jgi:AcrR family transcriptional regulator
MPRRKSISDEELLERALPVIARLGPDGFTLADVAGEVGIAAATLLQRFGDKQTLVKKAFAQDNERFVRWLEGLPSDTGADAVIRIYCQSTELFGDQLSLADHLLWLREDIRDPTFNRLSRERFKLFRKEIVKRLPPMPIPADRAASLLDAQFHGAVIQWAIEPKGKLARFVQNSLRDWFALSGSRKR